MVVVIPARFSASRLPGKPLADINGKPLIQHVYERACESSAGRVIVATDDARIEAAARAFGADVCLTRADHNSGTERIAEVVARYGIADDAVVVNLQGDEPLMPPGLIRAVAELLAARPDASMATACHPIADMATWRNPNVAKVVCDARGDALYFSRAPIPWPRSLMSTGEPDGANPAPHAQRHIGLYAYRAGFIREYTRLPASPLEAIESLEQLRVLWHGYRIAVHVSAELPGPGVDTPEDLAAVRAIFSRSR